MVKLISILIGKNNIMSIRLHFATFDVLQDQHQLYSNNITKSYKSELPETLV